MRDDDTGTITRRGLLLAGGGVAAAGGGWFVLSNSNSLLSSPPLDQVEIQFTDIRRPNFGATTATLPLLLTFINEADNPIPGLSGDFDVFISDQRVASDDLSVSRLAPG